MSRYDKCRQEINPEHNDLSLVIAIAEAIKQGVSLESDMTHAAITNYRLGYYSRHFLPVCDTAGNVLCEGSPSRAQYIEGQPRDTRGYAYVEASEPIFRAAYAKAQEGYPYQ